MTKLTFVFSRPKEHEVTQGLIRVYSAALRRLGIEFAFKDVPAKRASEYSNSGQVDGELSRVHDYDTKYANLVRIEEANHSVIFAAFSIEPTQAFDGWMSLQNTQHRVECRRGVKRCIGTLKRIIPPERFSEASTLEQAMRKLLAGRTDILIENRRVMLAYLDSDAFLTISAGRTVHEVGIMEETSGHGWLHRKHAALAPKLAEVLREMKREGIFQRLREQPN